MLDSTQKACYNENKSEDRRVPCDARYTKGNTMTLNKCFTDVFSTTMKQAGFTQSGLLYYRMHGNMLQGVFLKTCNPFQICFASIPYWMYNAMAYPDIKKGWWTQEGGFLMGFYYNPQEPEQNHAQMQAVLDCFTHTVLAHLDSMKTEQDYFFDSLKGVRNLSSNSGSSKFMLIISASLKPEILLHQKYLGELPLPVENYLDNYFDALLSCQASNTAQSQKTQQTKEFLLSKINGTSKEQFLKQYADMCADMDVYMKGHLKFV